jgi:arsenite methyltransferase
MDRKTAKKLGSKAEEAVASNSTTPSKASNEMKPTSTELQKDVKQRFAKVARSPDQEKKFPVGPASAKKLGYNHCEMDVVPSSVTESFCGVGNPLGLGELRAGQTVLDLGSGAGLDSLLAARKVGPTGRVVGVDLCEEMVAKARHNAELLGLNNVEFVSNGIEKLPLPNESVDVVISNGVFKGRRRPW